MYLDKVEFKNRTYNLRLINFGDEWGQYFAGSIQLNRALEYTKADNIDDEAGGVDELVFFYVPTHYFKLYDAELRDKILGEI